MKDEKMTEKEMVGLFTPTGPTKAMMVTIAILTIGACFAAQAGML